MNETLTEYQMNFVSMCCDEGLEIDYNYSGRGMFGRTCPAVRIDYLCDFPGNPNDFSVDRMGLGYVVYAR